MIHELGRALRALLTRTPVAARALEDPETPALAFDVHVSWRPAEARAR